jgi:hypothetical protein
VRISVVKENEVLKEYLSKQRVTVGAQGRLNTSTKLDFVVGSCRKRHSIKPQGTVQ